MAKRVSTTGSAGNASPERLIKLATWLSPAFPIGAFSYSHGLECAMEDGSVRTQDDLRAWLLDVLQVGGGWTDAVLFAEAWRAAHAADWVCLAAACELAEALAPSRERHLETMQQGSAFLAAVSAWPCGATEWLRAMTGGRAALPIAAAVAAAGHGISAAEALPLYLNAFAANLVSVAVRLMPLGQSAGLTTLAALQPVILALAGRALASKLDDLGSCAILSDVASMRHETQYSRLFRS